MLCTSCRLLLCSTRHVRTARHDLTKVFASTSREQKTLLRRSTYAFTRQYHASSRVYAEQTAHSDVDAILKDAEQSSRAGSKEDARPQSIKTSGSAKTKRSSAQRRRATSRPALDSVKLSKDEVSKPRTQSTSERSSASKEPAKDDTPAQFAAEKTEKPKSTQKKTSRLKSKQTPEPKPKSKPKPWQIQKASLEQKFKEGYEPRKRLSPDALPGIRMLHASDPQTFSTPILAEHFKVSPEAIRRILKSSWRPNEAEEEDRRMRWDRRGERIWTKLAELGTRPPKKWRSMGVGRVDRRAGELPAWRRKKRDKEEEEEDVPFVEDDDLIEDESLRRPRFADRIP